MSLRIVGIVLIAIAATAAQAGAQRVADLRPVGVVLHRQSDAPRPLIPSVAEGSKRHHLWPWFVLGSAVAGAGTVVAIGAKNCDLNCRDDGGWAQVPYYAAIGAGIGAVVGGVLGVIIDSSRGDAAVSGH